MVSGHPANAWTARAESLGAIAKELNDAGIPTLRGMVNGPQSRCSVCWAAVNRRWTAKEERRLFKLRADGKSIADIAKRLKRTEAAVSVRLPA